MNITIGVLLVVLSRIHGSWGHTQAYLCYNKTIKGVEDIRIS